MVRKGLSFVPPPPGSAAASTHHWAAKAEGSQVTTIVSIKKERRSFMLSYPIITSDVVAVRQLRSATVDSCQSRDLAINSYSCSRSSWTMPTLKVSSGRSTPSMPLQSSVRRATSHHAPTRKRRTKLLYASLLAKKRNRAIAEHARVSRTKIKVSLDPQFALDLLEWHAFGFRHEEEYPQQLEHHHGSVECEYMSTGDFGNQGESE